MDKEKQNIAIASSLGLEVVPCTCSDKPWQLKASGKHLPDYTTDRNAMHGIIVQALISNGDNFGLRFNMQLAGLIGDGWVWAAGTSILAEAYLKTIGKWNKEPEAIPDGVAVPMRRLEYSESTSSMSAALMDCVNDADLHERFYATREGHDGMVGMWSTCSMVAAAAEKYMSAGWEAGFRDFIEDCHELAKFMVAWCEEKGVLEYEIEAERLVKDFMKETDKTKASDVI